MSGRVLNSLNFFVDTSRDLGQGDDATVHLQDNSIAAGDGQLLKVSLSEFTMYKSFYGVNANNGKFRLTADADVTELELAPGNYRTVSDVAAEFAEQLRARLHTNTGVACTVVDLKPTSGTLINSTDDRIISFEIDFGSSNHGLSTFRVQCFTAVSDSYALLGGNRIDDDTSTASSFEVSIHSSTQLRVKAYYPAQRSTESHIYVRTDLRSNNVETASLSAATGPYSAHTLSSNILAKVPVDIEFVQFSNAGSTDEFFVTLAQRGLSSMRLYLTDSKGRPLGRPAGSGSKTAAGSGSAQSTLGNLSFTATLRIDVIQASQPNELQTPSIPRPIPGRFIKPVEWEDYGKPKV